MNYKFDANTQYYVISDLHGQGKIYDYIVSFFDLEAKRTGKKIVLIINGDIIDRGNDSIRMLVDVMERVKHRKGNIDVVMLPGNHEEMMCRALEYFRVNRVFDKGPGYTYNNMWFMPDNHGIDTCNKFFELPPQKQQEVLEFLKSLPLYFRVKSNNPNYNSYVIVHATPPSNAMISKEIPTLGRIISDDRYKVLRECLTYRKEDEKDGDISLSDRGVITIIGHTPVETANGFIVKENGKLLMIDGGCGYMAQNPNSKIFPEMATLVELSEVPGKTRVFLYGDENQEHLRVGKK